MPNVVDACCTINLYAAGNLLALLPALGSDWYIPQRVMEEALYVRRPDPDDTARLIKEPIDLKPALNAGALRICDAATEQETALFVELVVTLDDGEALALALAQSRGWTLATDDRKARRLAGERGVVVLTTAEIVKLWAKATTASEAEVAIRLQNVQTFANFVPHKTMPLYSWWVNAISKAGG